VYWQWIGYLSRANRAAKPLSSHVSFACSKFFLMVDTEEKLFKCGLQVERGCVRRTPRPGEFDLRSDWDWHRLMKSLHSKGTMDSELKRLVRREGFCLRIGTWSEPACFSRANWPGVPRLRHLLASITPDEWAGFQLYYPMREQQVLSSN